MTPGGCESKNLVLIHGWGFSGQIWSDFIPYVCDQRHITIINLPGYGKPENITNTGQADINKIVSLVSEHVPGKSIIFAWSLGGLIATRLACIRKDIVSLILIASSPCFLMRPDWKHGVDPIAFDRLEKTLSEDKKKALQQFSRLVAIGDKRPKETITKLNKQIVNNEADIETLNAGLKILRQQDLRSAVKNLSCPTGMIFGEKDVLVKRSTREAIKTMRPDINMIEIADTGHAPFLTRPRETAEALKKLTGDIF